MTPQEAIELIESARKTMYLPKSKEYISDFGYALEMAIKALEQQPCEDCISRTTLLSRIDAERKHLLDIKMDGAEHVIVHHARRIIEDMPSVTPKARWIPCSEKMPDINIHVLAQFVMGGMAECYYAHNWWHIVGGFRISGDEVIAWMPIPQPYAESEER